jgi:Regulator of chromosome condensation (RCC1) repeat
MFILFNLLWLEPHFFSHKQLSNDSGRYGQPRDSDICRRVTGTTEPDWPYYIDRIANFAMFFKHFFLYKQKNSSRRAPLSVQHVGVRHIACGSGHTVVLSNAGEIYSVGRGDDGRLGHGDNGWKCTLFLLEL